MPNIIIRNNCQKLRLNAKVSQRYCNIRFSATKSGIQLHIVVRMETDFNRIYIHRTTLKAMGDPAFVSLGIHPQSKKLVVLAARKATADALRVRCWR